MVRHVLNFLNLTSPFILAILYLVLVFTLAPTELQIYVPLVGPYLALQHTITNPRPFLMVLVLIFLALPAFRNYHGLFPKHMKIQVFYDANGIESTLRMFSEAERGELRIEEDWRKAKYYQLYLDKLDALIRRFHLPSHIKFNESTHAEGEVTISIRRIRGLQKYQIEEIKGQLRFAFPTAFGNPNIIRDDFELLPSKANVISVSLKDIYIGWTIIMQPRFNQYVTISPTHHFHVKELELIGITKLRFFPFIDCGRTVFFVEDTHLLNKQSDKPKLIPIGYQINIFD
jgi:hypothetical protein